MPSTLPLLNSSSAVFIISTLLNIILVDGQQYAGIDKRRCLPDLAIAWSRELSVAPISSAPLIEDVNADGDFDIITTTFNGDVHVVRAVDGRYVRSTAKSAVGYTAQGSGWPFRIDHGTFHSSPLLFDADGDGTLDILVISSSGLILFLTPDGQPVPDKQHQLEKISVDMDWYGKQVTADQELIHQYILDDVKQALPNIRYAHVDPHVLATALIDDVNGDGIVEELVIPVSYYYDLDDYRVAQSMAEVNMTELSENFLVSALVYLNLTSMQPYLTIHLDLTKRNSEYPAYLFASPTVAELDPKIPGLETVIGTAAGRLHVVYQQGHPQTSDFPLHIEPVHTQVSVSDLNGDGTLEIIVTDTVGVVSCYSNTGVRLWEAELTYASRISQIKQKHGSQHQDENEMIMITSGGRVVDLNGDRRLEVLVASNNGQIWLLDGESGNLLPDWPIELGQSLSVSPLLTRMHGSELPALVSLANDGTLNMITTKRACRNRVKLGESSLVSLLSHDLIPTNPGLEFLVATRDGALVCLFQTNSTDGIPQREGFPQQGGIPQYYGNLDEEERLMLRSLAQPAELSSHNDFTSLLDRSGLWIIFPVSVSSGQVIEITTAIFDVNILLMDVSDNSGPYQCQISLGGIPLHTHTLTHSGSHILQDVASPTRPARGHLVVECRNKHGVVLRDITAIRFFQTFLGDLQWLLIGPSLFLAALLLFLFGFPAADILPVTVPAKHR